MSDCGHISCREAIEQLWAYIDGELGDTDTRSVKEHLGACRGCYPQYDFQRAFCAFLHQHAQKPVPASLRRKVFMALLEEDRRQRTPIPGDGPERNA
jgi:anti-sigma factor (TIGR02949 family)